ncbi:MAG: hypothetical protein ACE5GQ_12375 [Nitrospinales bacterium]
MRLPEKKVIGIKVVNIFEENASAIEKMANKIIDSIHEQNNKILDIQITEDNIFFILGEGGE